jgi:site-specific DNA recombinase
MYCMYLRKSRADIEAEARGEAETLARHEAMLWELAKRLNLYIPEGGIYREVVSGETIASRPVMQKLLTDVEQGMWQGVLVVEVERLARGDTMDQGLVAQTFKYSNTKIITPMKTYNPADEFDEEFFEFGLFMSRREYKTINRRLQAGRLASAKEGKYVGNKPPYGYVRKKLEGQKGYTLEPHPEQAPVVKMIYDLYTGGSGISVICRRLNDMKIPAAKGGIWVPVSVRGILSNPTYIGKIRWNFRPQIKKMLDGQIVKERPRADQTTWTIVDGLHEAIIDEETFNAAQKILAENPSVPAPKYLGVKNPLAGLIECGMCGRNMVRRPYPNYPDTIMCQAIPCPNVSSHLHLVESRLLQALEDWLDRYKVTITQEDNRPDKELLEQSIERTAKEIEILEKQMGNLHDLLEQGVYTVETFLERSNLLKERIDDAQKVKEELKQQLKGISLREKSKTEMLPAVEKVIDLYWKLESPEDKNKLLKEVLEKAVYTKEVSGRWHASPDDFKLVVYPKLPK